MEHAVSCSDHDFQIAVAIEIGGSGGGVLDEIAAQQDLRPFYGGRGDS
ncbi:MAG: hypothetical protein ACLFTI_06380 [Anaerolineales bacterium]